MKKLPLVTLLGVIVIGPMVVHSRSALAATKIIVTIDRGRDLGQSFGSLF